MQLHINNTTIDLTLADLIDFLFWRLTGYGKSWDGMDRDYKGRFTGLNRRFNKITKKVYYEAIGGGYIVKEVRI